MQGLPSGFTSEPTGRPVRPLVPRVLTGIQFNLMLRAIFASPSRTLPSKAFHRRSQRRAANRSPPNSRSHRVPHPTRSFCGRVGYLSSPICLSTFLLRMQT